MDANQIKAYHDKVDDTIRRHGYHVTYVNAGAEPSFCYSTGVYKTFGIPEIFISSLPPNLSGELVEQYVSKFKDIGAVPVNQSIHDLSDRFPVYLINTPMHDLKEYVLSSVRFYQGQGCEYVQLVYPDTAGKFPDEAGYNYDQVIIGRFKS